MGMPRSALIATLLLAIVTTSIVATIANASAWGRSWRCVTASVFGWGGWVSLSKSGSAKIIYAGWNYPAYRYGGTWAWYKEYVVLWTWSDRSARVHAVHRETGRALGWYWPPNHVHIQLRVRLISDHRGYVDTEMWVRISPKYFWELKSIADRYGLTKMLKRLFVLLVAGGVAEAAAEGAIGYFAHLAGVLGAAYVVARILVPFDAYCGVAYRPLTRVCSGDLVGAWATLFDSKSYVPEWKFEYYDDSGCDYCFLWWCWWCQDVKYPLGAAGVSIVADPVAPPPYNSKYLIARYVTINGSTAYVTIAVVYPANESAPITGEKVVTIPLGNKTMVLSITRMPASKALAETDTIVVKGTPVAMPKATNFIRDTVLSSIVKKPVYTAIAWSYDPRLNATLLTYVTKIGEEQGQNLGYALAIGGTAAVIIAVVAIVALAKAPRAATSVILEARRRFVRRRTQ